MKIYFTQNGRYLNMFNIIKPYIELDAFDFMYCHANNHIMAFQQIDEELYRSLEFSFYDNSISYNNIKTIDSRYLNMFENRARYTASYLTLEFVNMNELLKRYSVVDFIELAQNDCWINKAYHIIYSAPNSYHPENFRLIDNKYWEIWIK